MGMNLFNTTGSDTAVTSTPDAGDPNDGALDNWTYNADLGPGGMRTIGGDFGSLTDANDDQGRTYFVGNPPAFFVGNPPAFGTVDLDPQNGMFFLHAGSRNA